MAVSSVRVFNSLKLPGASLIAYSTVHLKSPSSLDYNSFWVKGGFVSSSISGSPRVRAVVRDKGEKPEDHTLSGDSTDNFDDKQVIDSWPRLPERDFAGTPYVPVYVMLPVLNAAWDVSILVASENALPCYDREGYNKILENAKPQNDPDDLHLSAFTYLRFSPVLTERHNFAEFERFVKRMHGEAVPDLQLFPNEKPSTPEEKDGQVAA